jgi:hypothetical protein
MERDNLGRRDSVLAILYAVGILSTIMFTVFGLMAPVCADESITVWCYKDVRSSFSVGSVVVYDVAEAAQACNSMYYDCRGRCIGCYQDFDYADNVCVNMQGNTFLR